jgi:hypothetical protein
MLHLLAISGSAAQAAPSTAQHTINWLCQLYKNPLHGSHTQAHKCLTTLTWLDLRQCCFKKRSVFISSRHLNWTTVKQEHMLIVATLKPALLLACKSMCLLKIAYMHFTKACGSAMGCYALHALRQRHGCNTQSAEGAIERSQLTSPEGMRAAARCDACIQAAQGLVHQLGPDHLQDKTHSALYDLRQHTADPLEAAVQCLMACALCCAGIKRAASHRLC